jgi:hypothetical protein
VSRRVAGRSAARDSFWLRATWIYPRLVLRLGSLTIAAVATVWLIERTFGPAWLLSG